MLFLYYTDIRQVPDELDDSRLSEYKKDRLSHLRNKENQKQSAAAEFLLISALQELFPSVALPLTFTVGEQGKPALLIDGIHCSFSHSGNWAACAVSNGEIGLDLQVDSDGKLDIAQRFFTAEEYESICCAKHPDHEFGKLWSLKESYIKALGIGLQRPLDSFNVVTREERIYIREQPQIGFWHAYAEGCHFSLCSLLDSHPVPQRFEKRELLFG